MIVSDVTSVTVEWPNKETENSADSEGFTLQHGLMTLDPLVKKRRKSEKY